MRPSRPSVLALALLPALAWLPAEARAAQITEVADAADGDDPFDVNIELKFDVVRHTGLITRENYQPPATDPAGAPRVTDVRELAFERLRYRARPRIEVGIFHDLALFMEWPVVLWDEQRFSFAEGTTDANSTFARDAATAPGVDAWPETEGSGNAAPQILDGKYGFPGKAYNAWRLDGAGQFVGHRQGLDNPTLGLRFSPLNNARDETKPTVTVQADYTAPFMAFMDPTNDVLGDAAAPGSVADGAHRFHFSLAMSKRFLLLDPYFLVDYSLPLPASEPGSVLGFFPRQQGGFVAGMEIVPFEDVKRSQRFAIDVSTSVTYFAEGRDYSVVSDILREQTYTDQWVRIGANGGIFFRPFEHFFLNISGSVAVDTEHLLTIEDFGKDSDADENFEVNVENPKERNPFFNPVLDAAGRRVGLEESLLLGAMVHAGGNF